MKIIFTLIVVVSLFITSCKQTKNPTILQSGNWLFKLKIDSINGKLAIPFTVEILDSLQLIIKNGEEQIHVNEVAYKNDSVFIKLPVFGSEFKGKISGNNIFGNYYNYNKTNVQAIPFSGKMNVENRFEITENATIDFSGKWQTYFINEKDSSPAIGIFEQFGNKITGTFQTETGDYRYLEGVVNGNEMQLSCFDGAHAFLFEAHQTETEEINGTFYSGNTWQQKWVAHKTDTPKLENMKELTFLKPGYKKLSFSFPNEQQKTISLEDEKYKNKVVLVQIFGTWCPNCMDETRFLVEMHNKYNSEGLEIIGLDFEPKNEFSYFKSRIERFRKDLNVTYELLFAGPANKQLAAKSLPMLNKIISYPTVLFIDKKGDVREIHTGFSGPGTGENYENYKNETEDLIEKLLIE